MTDDQPAGAEVASDAVEPGEPAPAKRPPGALGLELIKSPQDGSADAVVSLELGSSYVVYHVAALTRLQDFFRTEQVCGSASPSFLLVFCKLTNASNVLTITLHGCRDVHMLCCSLIVQHLRPRKASSNRPTWRVSLQWSFMLCLSSMSVSMSRGCVIALVVEELHDTSVQVTDLYAVAARAAAQVDRARQSAKASVQAALSHKPKFKLHVTLDAPKVAIPIPAVPDTADGAVLLLLCELRNMYVSGS